MRFLQERHAAGEVVTGLLYLDPDAEDLHDRLGVSRRPLNQLADADLIPGSAALKAINDGLR
jgi:2-oxoglutarate ferredoxin oxidoreductase subunit beta